MAIYYINPHSTANGTGTFASPWSLSSSTRTGLVSGDEIRILGVALTSLLTATAYVATWTNTYTLTITSGGGLGADFAANNVIYLPDYGTFAKIVAVSVNAISLYATYGTFPINNSTASTINVRKVDTTTYPVSSAGGTYYIAAGAVNNLTISDGWTDATTRVTDGSVKTLFNNSGTLSTTCYFDSNSTGTYGHNINLPNTCVLNSNALTSNGTVTCYLYGSNSTYVIGQIFGVYVTGGLTFGSTTAPAYNTSCTVTHLGAGQPSLAASYGKSISLTVTNAYVYTPDLFTSATTVFQGVNGFTITINYMLTITTFYNNNTLLNAYNALNATVNYNGMIDVYPSSTVTSLVVGYGNFTVVYGAGFSYKYNKRVSTQTSFGANYTNAAFIGGNTYNVPTVTNPTGVTVTNKYVTSTAIVAVGTYAKVTRIPNLINISYPDTTPALPSSNMTNGINLLITYRDGSNPVEVLSIFGNGYSGNPSNAASPNVTKDSVVYRTSAPSLKSYLATRTAVYWTSPSATSDKTSTAIKTIKVPVTGGVSVTVSGYVRTDDAAYVTGDCDMVLNFNNVDVATQSMTTSCINAWEQFTLTFIPSFTGEAYLLWEMYYANGAKSYWLDDLTIT